MKVIYAVFVILILTSVSCNDSNVGQSFDSTLASTRSSQNLSVELVTTNNDIVNVDAYKVVLNEVSGTTFTVVIDDSDIYSALSIMVRHEDGRLRIIKNQNQSTYTYKTLLEAYASSNLLQFSIDGGGIITGTSVVIDEVDSI